MAHRPAIEFPYITECHRAYAQRRGHNAIHKGCCVAAGNDLGLRNGWNMTKKCFEDRLLLVLCWVNAGKLLRNLLFVGFVCFLLEFSGQIVF